MSYTNNAYGELLGSIGTDTTTITIKDSKGSLFPDTYPFYLTLEQIDNGIVSKREIVKCTNKSGDTFTITRSAGYCPANDNSTTQTNTAFAFEDGTLVQLRLLSEDVNKINTDISTKLNKDGELRTGLGANKIIYTDGNGNETELALGNASQVLTSNGTAQAPSFTSPSVDIDGQTEKTAPIGDDEAIIYDSENSVNKKATLTNLTKGLQQADETNFGVVKKATDSEVSDGTENTKYITPKQVKDNYNHRSNYGYNDQVSVDGNSTTDITITHNLGYVPDVICHALYNGNTFSYGHNIGGTEGCITTDGNDKATKTSLGFIMLNGANNGINISVSSNTSTQTVIHFDNNYSSSDSCYCNIQLINN